MDAPYSKDEARGAYGGVELEQGEDFDDLLHEMKSVRRRHTAGQAEGHPRNLLTIAEMNRRITLALARSVIQELRMKPFASHLRNSSGTASGLWSPDQFLVTERDIQKIIERSLLLVDDEDMEADDGDARPESAAPRRKTFSSVNLDSLSKGIRPRPSAVLDPATTISVPKTLFSSASKYSGRCRQTRSRAREGSITATVISRRSVAEITWTKNGGHIGGMSDSSDGGSDSASSDSLRTSPTRLLSVASMPPAGYLRQRRPTRNAISIRHELASGNVACRSPGRPPARVTFQVNAGGSSSKSRRRNSTIDWAEPIVWMGHSDGDRERAASTDMYDDGVDAHCGPASRRHTLFSEEELTRRWTTNRSIFDPAGHSEAEPWLARRSTLALPSLTRADTLGRGHPLPSHDRRRSVPALSISRADRQRSARSNLVDRMIGIGKRPASGNVLGLGGQLGAEYFDGEVGAWALPPNNSPSNTGGGQRSAQHAASQRRVDRRCQGCSEDGRPHVCVNDFDPSAQSDSSAN